MKASAFMVSNVEVVSELSPGLPDTMIDEHRMLQVFVNILTNAEQAIRDGKGRGRIEVTSTASNGEIEISIGDDGPGFSSEVRTRLFEPFFTTKPVGAGTGLGLSISYGIVQAHGGDLSAESVEGEGTSFRISIPIVTPTEAKVEALARPASIDKTTKRLLVVDDEPQIRGLFKSFLGSEGYAVDVAQSGEEAWQRLVNIEYDCVLVDLTMPGMSGQELYQLTSEESAILASKIVFITGDTMSSRVGEFLSKVENPVLAKPMRLANLSRTVQEHIDRLSVG